MSNSWDQSHDEWRDWLKSSPILKTLYDARIFSVGGLINGKIGFVEACDENFGVEMTPDDVRALSAELARLAEQVETREPTGALQNPNEIKASDSPSGPRTP